jgi:hypothetical protein
MGLGSVYARLGRRKIMKLYPHTEELNSEVCVVILVRPEGPGISGDAWWVVRPGGSVAGMDYQQWLDAARAGQAVDFSGS